MPSCTCCQHSHTLLHRCRLPPLLPLALLSPLGQHDVQHAVVPQPVLLHIGLAQVGHVGGQADKAAAPACGGSGGARSGGGAAHETMFNASVVWGWDMQLGGLPVRIPVASAGTVEPDTQHAWLYCMALVLWWC